MSDTLEKLGKIITPDEKRDAVHIAVAPVIAVEPLSPGDDVGFVRAGDFERVGKSAAVLVGIVDPFLPLPVGQGQWCWVFLYPQTITSLRHEWTHPAFGPSVERSEAERWLLRMADRCRIPYDEMVRGAQTGEGACFGDDDGPQEARSSEFWSHIETVTGRRFDEDHRENTYFRCAC